MRRGFENREDAGVRLARTLEPFRGHPGLLVVALPRGGVPVGFEVAIGLDAELDIIVVRKIGVPGHEEYAMGAVASGPVVIRNEEAIAALHISDETFETATGQALDELKRREERLRGSVEAAEVAGRTVIVVDDGIATGSTMRAAIAALRKRDPARLVVAVPVAPPDSIEDMRQVADEVVCLLIPRSLVAVGAWYRDFGQTSDETVRRLLDAAANR